MKKQIYGEPKKLNLQDVLTALSICETTNPTVELALSKLDKLKGMDAHATCMLPKEDINILKKLKINITCEPEFNSNKKI